MNSVSVNQPHVVIAETIQLKKLLGKPSNARL